VEKSLKKGKKEKRTTKRIKTQRGKDRINNGEGVVSLRYWEGVSLWRGEMAVLYLIGKKNIVVGYGEERKKGFGM